MQYAILKLTWFRVHKVHIPYLYAYYVLLWYTGEEETQEAFKKHFEEQFSLYNHVVS